MIYRTIWDLEVTTDWDKYNHNITDHGLRLVQDVLNLTREELLGGTEEEIMDLIYKNPDKYTVVGL